MTSKLKDAIFKATVGKFGISYAQLGRKFRFDPKKIKNILKDLNIVRKQRKRAPMVEEEQGKREKERLPRLVRTDFAPKSSLDVVMDDETYFDLNGHYFIGNSFFYESPYLGRDEIDENIRYRKETKFPEKLMLWVAIRPKVIAAHWFKPLQGAVAGKLNAEECFKKRLVPFIKRYYSDGKYILWSD